MKNKKKVYLLIVVVIIIWGAVIFQFLSLSNSVAIQEPAVNDKPLIAFNLKIEDTSTINVDYRDPFLGKIYVKEEKIIERRRLIAPKKTNKQSVLPNIIYKGIVSDTKSDKKVYMLIIDGKNLLMKNGDAEGEIKLVEGNRKSVSIKFMGEKHTILLEE